MSFSFNGNTPRKIIFNNQDVKKLIYNNDVVWEKKRLPVEYQEVEYIESTGTQYIDTGFVPEIGDTFDIDYKYTILPIVGKYQALMSAGTNNYQLILLGANDINLGKGFFYKYFATGSAAWFCTNPSVNEWYNITINSNGKATSNGQTSTSKPVKELDGTNTSLYLFIRRNGIWPFYGAIRKFQILRNGALALDLIPAKRNSDNVLGMYDTVNGQFYTNQGTGTFLYGEKEN